MSRLPTLSPRQVIAALKKAGFTEHHQRGSHLAMRHADGRRVIVPVHARDIKRPLLRGILKQADVSEDAFRSLL